MRSTLTILVALAVWAPPMFSGEEPTSAFQDALLDFESAPAAREFPADQTAFVQSWIRQVAPECPVDVSATVAQSFLEELSLGQPGKYARLMTPGFALQELEPQLLRLAGAKLTGPTYAAQREKLAERRVKALLVESGGDSSEAGRLIEEIREDSSYQHRRLIEGRIDDSDLTALLRRSLRPGEPAPTAPAPPKVDTAAEIVAEFARRNQTGNAVLRLQAYLVEGELTHPNGGTGEIVIAKMRPDRMRFTLLKDGLSRHVLGAIGGRFWRQVPGQPPEFAAGSDLGDLRYSAEFSDPLFAADGYEFDRLPDGEEAGAKFHRIQVRRADGSEYVARIEHGSYRQIGRENPDGTVAHYSDFRDVAGVMFAFREELVDPRGSKTVVTLTRIMPNPGLVGYYFVPQNEPGQGYFQLERFIGPSTPETVLVQ